MLGFKLGHQIIKGQVTLFGNPPFEPIANGAKLAMTSAIPLRLGIKGSGLPLQFDHVIHKFDRNPEMRGGRTVAVPFFDKINNALPEFYRMWLTQFRPPYLPQAQGITAPALGEPRIWKIATRSKDT